MSQHTYSAIAAEIEANKKSARGDMAQEFNGSQHRLLENGKPVTPWARYQQIVTYKGYVGHTAYYGNGESICTAQEFVEMIAVQGAPE